MKVLAFFAHPDDETMLAGGTLALLAGAGAQVNYLIATRGEGGEVGEPPVARPEELGDVREQEIRCAVEALGGSSLSFLDYVDPRIGPDDSLFTYTEDVDEVAGRVRETLVALKIDLLISHGKNGEYGHPAHVLTYQAARQAVAELEGQGPAFYTAAACFPGHPRPHLANKDDQADLVLDIGPALARKTRAALCHQSQHALFIRRPSEAAGHSLTVPEVILAVESLHRVRGVGEGERGRRAAEELKQLLEPHLIDLATLEGECSQEASQA